MTAAIAAMKRRGKYDLDLCTGFTWEKDMLGESPGPFELLAEVLTRTGDITVSIFSTLAILFPCRCTLKSTQFIAILVSL
jgi:hypothetical protein